MHAYTTTKRLLEAFKVRMKGVKPRATDAMVCVQFQRDAITIDAVSVPAEVIPELVGITATLNGFLLLELLRKLKTTVLLTVGFSDENCLTIEAGTFRVDLIPSAFERPTAQFHTETEVALVTEPQPVQTMPKRKRDYSRRVNHAAYPVQSVTTWGKMNHA